MLGIEDMMVNKIEVGFCFHGAHIIVRVTKKKYIDKIKISCNKSPKGNKAMVEHKREEKKKVCGWVNI